jgi:predicted signal transduction protein with EAL and GGDEF domain
VGERLRRQIRHGDLGARLGGDEFAVIAPELDGTATAAALAERLRAALGRPFHLRGLAIEVETSIGIAVFPEHGADVETLLRHADVAMYLAKESRSGVELYSPAKDTYSPDRLRLVGELRGALEQGQLVLHYQPQAALATGDVRRVEALLRWQHPDRGLLAADAFVPPAEHTGLVRPLTRWVLETALRQCLDWRRRGIELGVAVNITGRDLIDLGLADEVAGLLRRWRVPPHLLELEVTETTVLSDPMRARAILTRLSELGVRIAIDDFGRGNSSLGYLKRLPVDVLKIDKSFVLNMIDDQDDAVIVRSTIDLAHNLGLEVVAEGVESEAAWTRLGSLGCDTAQGYYVGRPAPAEALPTRVSGSAPRRAAASQ